MIGYAELAAATGQLFIYAVIAQFVALLVEHAGSAVPVPEGEERRGAPMAIVTGLNALIAPFLLLWHGYINTMLVSREAVITMAAAVVGSIIAGSIIGRVLGGAVQPLAQLCRAIAWLIAGVALALVIYATWDSIQAAIAMAQGQGPLQLRWPF